MKVTWRLCCIGLGLSVGVMAFAQPYPTRPVRFIVPNPAGGGADTTARIIASRLSERINQQFVIDNRPGAGGTIGLGMLARAPADGYTIGMGVTATLAISPFIYSKLSYDSIRDFAPISLFTSAPLLLVVPPSSAVKSLSELIAQARLKPRHFSYGSAGIGTPPHLSAELFKSMAGIQAVHVPYKGAPPALTGLMGGEIAFMFGNMLPTLPHVKSGRLLGIAVTSARRSSVLAGVPTVAESGVPGYESDEWYGVVAPAGTPDNIVARLSKEIARIAHLPELKEQFENEASYPVGSTPSQFAAFIRVEQDKWARVVRISGARAE